MNPVLLIAIGAGGAVLGVIVGSIMFGKGKELEETSKQLAQVRRDTSEQLDKLKASESELRKDLESTKAKASKADAATAKAEEATTKVRGEADQLKTKLREAETARDQSSQQVQSLQAAHQQAEGRAQQAEKLAGDASARLGQLEADLAATQKSLVQAQAAAGTSASGLDESIELFADAGGSLDQILEVLLMNEDQSAAVLSDSNGIVVAAAGDKDLRDGIAAAAQLMTRIGNQFEGMVPFGLIRGFELRDTENKVIAGRATSLSGEVIAVTTYGKRPPASRVLDGAMASLSAELG